LHPEQKWSKGKGMTMHSEHHSHCCFAVPGCIKRLQSRQWLQHISHYRDIMQWQKTHNVCTCGLWIIGNKVAANNAGTIGLATASLLPPYSGPV